MKEMFYCAYIFNQDISMWDTSRPTDMRGMFHGVDAFNQSIVNWHISNKSSCN